jgi:hypothetical protein
MTLSKLPKYFCFSSIDIFLSACASLSSVSDKSANGIAANPAMTCEKKVESYLMAIGNLDSESYEVIEIQAGLGAADHHGSVVYNSKYRLSGYPREHSMKLVLDSKTCALKSADISRD